MAKHHKLARMAALAAAMGLVATLGLFGAVAMAGSAPAANPTPTCPDGFVFNPKTATCDKVTVTNVTAVVGGKSVSAQSVATGQVIFAAEMHIRGVKVNSRNCFWTKPGQPWQNGFNTAGGGVIFHTETTPAQLCHWHGKLVKVAGGETGRLCFNLAKLGPGPKQNVTVVVVNSFKVTIPLKAEVSVEIQENGCKASASAMASARISLSKFIKAKGRVDVKVFESAIVSLSTAVHVEVNCQPTTVTVITPGGTTTTVVTTPPSTSTTHTTTVTTSTTQTITTTPPPAQPPSLSNATQPQEVFANGETYPNICVTASAKNGNSITVGFGSNFGSMSPSSSTFTSGGVDRVCSTYTAPNTPDAADRTETITFTVHDNTTGLNGSSVSVSFPIQAPPPRP